MRRAKPLSVKVRAPSRGLVNRLPGESADLLPPTGGLVPSSIFLPSTMMRASSVASNVRYEDGVVCAAPGYQSVQWQFPILDNILAHWRCDEVSGTVLKDSVNRYNLTSYYGPREPIYGSIPQPVVYTPGKIGGAVSIQGYPGSGVSTFNYYAGDTSVVDSITSANVSGVPTDFTVAFWFNTGSFTTDGQLFSFSDYQGAAPAFSIGRTSGNLTIYWADADGAYGTAIGPAFPTGAWTFIVVQYTVSTGAIGLNINGSYVALTGAHTMTPGAGLVDDGSTQLGPDQNTFIDSITVWGRSISLPEITFLYNSGKGLDYPFLGGAFNLVFQGNLVNSNNATPLVLGSDAGLFAVEKSFVSETKTFLATLSTLSPNTAVGLTVSPCSQGYSWTTDNFFDKLIFAQHDNQAQYWLPGASATPAYPVPGLPTTDNQWDGVTVFQNHVLLWLNDRLKWSDVDDFSTWIPVDTTAVSAALTLLGASSHAADGTTAFTQPALGGSFSVSITNPVDPATLAVGQTVSLQDTRAGVTYYNFYQVTAATPVVGGTPATLTLTLLSLTGATPAGLTMPADNRQFFTLDANEAGEAQIVGARMNGPIFRIVPQGDYAYIYKERSIQSIQYTGIDNGVFYIHNEISGEGLISREAVCDRQDGTMVFLGHKELYAYQGGGTLTPVCQQATKQMFNELDRSRLYAIRVFHVEGSKEIWVKYPIPTGGFRVLIWNYIEDSASLDDYDPSVEFTAFGLADWSSDTIWLILPDSTLWGGVGDNYNWQDFETGSIDHVPVTAGADGMLRIHGLVYDRDGQGYTTLSESMDYDLGDSDIYKYVDVVVLGLDVKFQEDTPRTMYVQVGAQDSLGGAPIRWTNPIPVLTNGTAPVPVKVNPGGAGRYLRVRFTSSDPDVQWRVSSFEIHCRPGGTY